MAIKYDIDGIFAELEKKIMREKRKNDISIDEKKQNEYDIENEITDDIQDDELDERQQDMQDTEQEDKEIIESPEDAPETDEVAPATSKTTEDMHGGDESSKQVENSPNPAENGKNAQNGKGKGEVSSTQKGEFKPNEDSSKEDEDYYITTNGLNPSKTKPKTTPEDCLKRVKDLFEQKNKEIEDFKQREKIEYLKKYIIEVIKKIAAEHAGIDKQDGCESFDKKEILRHMVKSQYHKIPGDKYDLKDARYVQFFIDTSGIYGNSSNRAIQDVMPQIIDLLSRQGYECYIAACGNGFYSRDMEDDTYYGTRKTLEDYNTGKVSKIACPTSETAAKMANEAEFTVILADFDGLSSICEMASLCQKDKVPYFLCTEDRYSWEDPTMHDWVDPELCEYDMNKVYDVSILGNPNREQAENYWDDYYNNDDEYEYDEDDREYDE